MIVEPKIQHIDYSCSTINLMNNTKFNAIFKCNYTQIENFKMCFIQDLTKVSTTTNEFIDKSNHFVSKTNKIELLFYLYAVFYFIITLLNVTFILPLVKYYSIRFCLLFQSSKLFFIFISLFFHHK